jgi:hypothetical protein
MFASVAAAFVACGALACGSTSVTQVSGPSDVRCATSITANPQAVGADGGTVTIGVGTTRDCSWTSSSDVAWIRLSNASGQGEATFTANVDANPQIVSRSGNVSVNGQRTPITQAARPCTFSLDPTAAQLDGGGGSGRVTVTTIAGCAWRATSNASWIQVPSATRSGSGAIDFQVSANDGGDRTGVIAIADEQVVITQSAQPALAPPTTGPGQPVPPTCTPTVTPTTIDVSSVATTRTLQLVLGATCAWTATSAAPWVTITSPLTGTGNATIAVAIAPNTGAARNGTLTVAGQPVTVRQTALSCTFTLNPTSQNFPAGGGGGGRFTVTTAAACSWSASKSVPWIDVVQGTGTGTADVTFSVQANPSTTDRSGTLTVGGQAFMVTQAASQCTYTLNPNSLAVSADPAHGHIVVTTSPNCAWTAVAGASWVVLANQAGTGPGEVNFDVQANPTTMARGTTITIGDRIFIVNQAGVPCTYVVNPPASSAPAAASNSQFTVTTQAGCAWTAVSAAPWVVITAPLNGAGSGTGDVMYGVQANPDPAERMTTITVGGQTHAITQAAAPAPCTYTLNPAAATFTAAGETRTFSVNTQPGCAWTATTMDAWITVNTGAGGGTADVSYTVQPNATGMARSGVISVGGQTFGVTQAAQAVVSSGP